MSCSPLFTLQTWTVVHEYCCQIRTEKKTHFLDVYSHHAIIKLCKMCRLINYYQSTIFFYNKSNRPEFSQSSDYLKKLNLTFRDIYISHLQHYTFLTMKVCITMSLPHKSSKPLETPYTKAPLHKNCMGF